MRNIKAVFKCQEGYKNIFKKSSCLLTISVGQEVHEEEKLAATIDLVNENFKSCIIMVDDSLQRHTMALNSVNNADYFYEISLKEGELWLERNKKYYRNLTILKDIIRWDNWLFHPDFSLKREIINSLLKKNIHYKNAFDETINNFLGRYFRRLINCEKINIDRAKILCNEYLVEECAALCLWSELNSEFEIYPNDRNLAMQATYEKFILPKYPALLRSVAIKFKNKKQLNLEEFNVIKEEKCQVFSI